VLERWDWQRPDEWRSVLAQMVENRTDADEVAATLARFVDSSTFQRLATARVCHRDLEFLLRWPVKNGTTHLIRGMIDCLWQDGEGDWHVIAFQIDAVNAPARVRLVLAAFAVEQQFGVWPRTVSLYRFADGVVVEEDGEKLRHRTALREVQAALTAFLAPLPS
jgi:hypothetical protein